MSSLVFLSDDGGSVTFTNVATTNPYIVNVPAYSGTLAYIDDSGTFTVPNLVATGNVSVGGNISVAGNQSIAGNLVVYGEAFFSGTSDVKIPAGTTAERPIIASTGMIRFNTQTVQFEGYNGTSWGAIGGGGGGGGASTIYDVILQTVSIPRFAPNYWTINGPRTVSFCVVPYQNGIEAYYLARSEGDLTGLIWDSEDTEDQIYLKYATNKDYRNITWSFRMEVGPNSPVLSAQDASILTIKGKDAGGNAVIYYVRLSNYADTPDARSANIILDFNTIKAGVNADVDMYLGSVDQIFFSCVFTGYIENSNTPLPTPIESFLRITNSTVTGNVGATLDITQAYVAPHQIGMSTSYDDMYNLNPQRAINNMYTLGYRNWINHYCGVSQYPSNFWNGSQYIVPNPGGVPVINPACIKWHTSFASEAKASGYQVIFSLSYEFFSTVANQDWCQREWNDTLAQTGYAIPTYLFSCCNATGQAYLHQAFVEMAAVPNSVGMPVYMQVGEPWWWINRDQYPCVFDYSTRVAFNAATGLYMADYGTVINALTLTQSPYPEQTAFLQQALGQSVQSMRTAVRAVYPNAQVGPLLYLPTILDASSGIMNTINYPINEYKYPNFDYFMTECYEWVTNGTLIKAYTAMESGLDTMGYPPEKFQYLGGYVNLDVKDPSLLVSYWERIIGNLKNNVRYNIKKQYVWAYPQVMKQNITLIDQNDLLNFYVGQTIYPAVRNYI